MYKMHMCFALAFREMASCSCATPYQTETIFTNTSDAVIDARKRRHPKTRIQLRESTQSLNYPSDSRPLQQELQGIAAGSAFDVTACTESVSMGHPSGVFGESLSRTIDAVPPALVNVRARPPDATTTELLVEYEVLGTAGRLYYALVEQSEMDKGGKVSTADPLKTFPVIDRSCERHTLYAMEPMLAVRSTVSSTSGI